jgi:palmitoyltransferase ZDHHC13/17
MKYGANIRSITNQGLTSMHIAAQGDQMHLLAYLKEIGFDFMALDSKGATPLHWASYLGCELSLAVLISWNAQINSTDNEGLTPLHLACIGGYARIVWQLVHKGALTHISDYRGRTPLDFAIESNYNHIISLLKPDSFLSSCGIKTPKRPVKYKRFLINLYILFLGFGISLNLLVLGNTAYDFLGLACLEIIFFIGISNKNPGFIEKTNESLLELCKKYDFFQICPQCVVKISPRSRHCECCNKCVEKFDHHCPWVNNCIGAKNLGIFYGFLLVTLLLILDAAYYDFYYLYQHFDPDHVLKADNLAAALCGFLIAGFTLPLFMLFLLQTRNFFSNTTTNERYSRHSIEKAHKTDSDDKVDRKNCLKNILDMCCNLDPIAEKINTQLHPHTKTRFSTLVSEYESLRSNLNNSS